MLLSTSAYSDLTPKVGEKRAPSIPMEHLTQGYEAESIEFNRGLDGRINSIEVLRCTSCTIETFSVTDSTKAYAGEHQIALEDLSAYNGKSGSIAYYPKTKELHHFRFFNLEAAQ
jgi:hypothetical protein